MNPTLRNGSEDRQGLLKTGPTANKTCLGRIEPYADIKEDKVWPMATFLRILEKVGELGGEHLFVDVIPLLLERGLIRTFFHLSKRKEKTLLGKN